MSRSQIYCAMFVLVLMSVLLVACAQATPTPVPTAVPKPTEVPKPTVAPTVAPTAAPKPTEAPKPTVAATTAVTPTIAVTIATPTGAALALASKKSTTEVLVDSFEKGTAGDFPPDWNILEKDNHVTNKSGPRVEDVTAVKGPDGKLAIKVASNPSQDGQMNRDFPALPQGRLTFYGMLPSKDPFLMSVELRDGGTRMFNLEMHYEKGFNYRDEKGTLINSNIKLDLDKWYQLIMEWDATASIWNGYAVIDGKQVLVTPAVGVPFPDALKGKAPNRIQLRMNREASGLKFGYVDGFKLFKIE